MKNIINILGALAVIASLIGLYSLFVLPTIKTNTYHSEEILSPIDNDWLRGDPYFQALRQAEQDSY